MKDVKSQVDSDEKSRKITLLRKYDIPIDHLDFDYVKSCESAKEIEKILKILRSGEEGFFPDLIKCTEDRLRCLDPENSVLRVELPVIRSQYLDKDQKEELLQDLSEWIENIKEDPSGSGDFCQKNHELFSPADLDESNNVAPVRGTKVVKKEEDSLNKKPNPNRIKSWEYDKWDKFDVDAELTRMEVTDMQISEWERTQKPKLKDEQKNLEGLMKGDEVKASTSQSLSQKQTSSSDMNLKNSQPKPMCSKVLSKMDKDKPEHVPVDKPSFIEDVTEVSCPTKTEEVKKPKRKIRVMIEDVNAGAL